MGSACSKLEFDFLKHVLSVSTDDGSYKEVGLFPRSVAEFYGAVMQALSEFDIDIHIHEMPNELQEAIRFSDDRIHASYDRDYAQRH